MIEQQNMLDIPGYVAGMGTELCRAIAGLKFRGIPRLLHATAPRVLGTGARIFDLDCGLKLVLDPTDYFQCMMLYGWFAPEILEVFRRFVHPADTVVDIGAQLGYFSQHLARLVGPRGRVFCFEPDSRAFSRLNCGLKAAGMTWMNTFPVAVTQDDGPMDFFVSPVIGWSTGVRSSGCNGLGRTTVQAASVDSLVARSCLPKNIKLFKIDVEGFELQVLRGMAHALERLRPVLIMEINPAMLHANGTIPGQILTLLKLSGYQVYRIERNTRWWRARPQMQIKAITAPPAATCDVLCTPDELDVISD